MTKKYNIHCKNELRTCEFCGKKYFYEEGQPNWQKDETHRGKGIRADRFCSYLCGMNYRKKRCEQTCLEKYGVKNGGGSEEAIKKILNRRNKNIETDKDFQIKVNEKRKTTNLKRYGVEYTGQSEIKKTKAKETNLKKYGVTHFSKTSQFKEKVKNTINKNKEKNPNYQKEINDKTVNTNLLKYGASHFGKTEKCKTLIKEKWKLKTKEELETIENKRKKTCLKKYGNENYRGREKIDWNNLVSKCFETKKNKHLLNTSKGENELIQYIKELGFKPIKYMIGNNHESKRFEIDIYIPELKIGIEYNGIYFHSIEGPNHKNGVNYHYEKAKIAKKLGISLIQIWEDQWQNSKDLIKSILRIRLGCFKNKTIYARQCTVKEISGKLYKDFCIINHIQGYRQASIKLGLFFENKLVQIASFNKVKNLGKQNRQEEWEWIRGCPASNNLIVGGVSKLFNYFVQKYNPKSILCYADWNLFDGNGYKQIGFEFDGYTGPNKFYITNTTDHIRINRNPYRYKELKQLSIKNKLYTCYGAGSLRFIWEKK